MIQIHNLTLSFPHKTCFEDFSVNLQYGSRIAIIGRNGSGKSTLLRMLKDIAAKQNMVVGYVPQIIEDFDHLSGGQRFNKALTEAIALSPDLLLLDEPTNHLDHHNRKSLMRMLRGFSGILIIVSHDVEILRNCVDTLWHIDNGRVNIFTGNYDDYMHEIRAKRTSIEQELSRLNRQKQGMHTALMKEQVRAAKSRSKGEKGIEQRKWPTIVSDTKARNAQETSGKKKSSINNKKQNLSDQLLELRLPEVIRPKFALNSADIGSHILVSIIQGAVGYKDGTTILESISLSVGAGDRVAIIGDNGSGKSTLIKAILDNSDVIKSGSWNVPKIQDIGYLDQHYAPLDSEKSALEIIQDVAPNWIHAEVRHHLNDFLFRKNEEVNANVSSLSGGEKVRLSLAQIAVHSPKLLILDEVTNNLDLETRQHVIEVLKSYPGAMIVVSHDEDFLNEIGINGKYELEK